MVLTSNLRFYGCGFDKAGLNVMLRALPVIQAKEIPMTQPPSASAYPVSPTPRTSGFAVASLICGILACIPFLTSLLAVVFGLIGLKQTRQRGINGRAMAVVGLILGFVGLVGWGAGGFAAYRGYHALMDAIQGPRTEASALFSDLAAGDLVEARARLSPEISEDQLRQTSEQIKPLGEFKSISLRSVDTSTVNDQKIFKLGGIAMFEQGTADFDVEIASHPTMGWTIRSYRLEPR